MSDFSFWRGSPADCQVASCQLPVATRWLDRDWLVGRLVGLVRWLRPPAKFFLLHWVPQMPWTPGLPRPAWQLLGAGRKQLWELPGLPGACRQAYTT